MSRPDFCKLSRSVYRAQLAAHDLSNTITGGRNRPRRRDRMRMLISIQHAEALLDATSRAIAYETTLQTRHARRRPR